MIDATALITGFFCFGLAISLYLWWWAIHRVRLGQTLIPFVPRRPVPWGGLATLLFLLGLFLAETVGIVAVLGIKEIVDGLETLSDKESLQKILLSGSAAKLIYFVVVIAVLASVGRATAKDLGFDFRYGWFDLVNGVFAFFMLVAVVFLIQGVLQWRFKYEHPILDLLKEDQTGWLFATAFISAVVVAPLIEEFFFRVILQGWFERVAHHRTEWRRPPLTTSGTVEPMATKIGEDDVIRCGAWWPIFASAALFALMHVGQGAAPIPLFVLAIGLGYLYQRTHRILSCIVVHTMLNAISLLAFLVVDAG